MASKLWVLAKGIGRAERFIPKYIVSTLLLFLGVITTAVGSQAQTLPQYGKDIHLGVVTCAGSSCHGAIKPFKKSTVLQNEYVVWQKKDKHAKAYDVLLNERSKRIARNLGLKAANTAKICLDCHADNVPKGKAGKTLQLSDGVGCEACHGGAQRWLGTHVAIPDHKQNVAAGLYPTEDPVARAKLCLSCHFGDQNKFVTHRIMGAGHPRMPFELDTFTAIQPAHYRIDSDYAKRKKIANGIQTWAIGQALAIQQTLDAMTDPKRNRDGIFPELVLFDCQSCHHPISNLRWQPRKGTGLPPGVARINDANLIMLRVIAKRIDPALGEKLFNETVALHQASTKGMDATAKAAETLKKTVGKLVGILAKHSFSKADMKPLLEGLIAEGRRGEFTDYAAAEQATMAMGSIIEAMRRAGVIDKKQTAALNAALGESYKAVEKDDTYRPETYLAALAKVDSVLKNL